MIILKNGQYIYQEDTEPIEIETEPTAEERLAALEKAMLDILIGGNTNV